MQHVLRASTAVPRPRAEVFDFFSDALNLQRITPPELGFQIVTPSPIDMGEGALIDYRLRLLGVPFEWRTEITRWSPPKAFTDMQISGPYAEWIHTHLFIKTAQGTEIVDHVQYALPYRPLGELAYPLVRLQLQRIFKYRKRTIQRLLGATRKDDTG